MCTCVYEKKVKCMYFSHALLYVCIHVYINEVCIYVCREKIYLQGRVLFITSRILMVDMLRKYCPVKKVAGLLVYNAHRFSIIYTHDNKIIVKKI